MNLFNLVAKLSLEDDSYEKGLDKAKKDASSFSSKAGVAFKNVGRVIAGVAGAVTSVATGIAALAVKTANYGDEIDKQSQKLGMSAEAYQKWTIAAEMAGSNAATLQAGIKELTKFTNELAAGTGDSLLALQKLGLGYDEFMAATPDEQLKMVVEAMQGLEDSTLKTQLAQQIFGESAYQELMPLLNQEKGSLDELFQSYEDLGLIMSDEMVEYSAKLNDKMTILTKQIQMMGLKIGTELYPQIELFVDGMSQILQGNFDEGFDKISDAILGLMQKVTDGLPKLLDILGTVLLKVLDTLLNILSDPKFIKNLLNALQQLLLKIIDMLPQLIDTLFDLVVALVEAILELDWGTLIAHLLDALMDIIFVKLPDLVFELINMVLDLILSGKIFEIIGKIGIGIGQGILNGLISIVESGINLILKGLNGMLGWLGVDIPLVSLPRVSFLAEGGIMDELGTLYVAGEKGAEIVATGSQGTGVANVEQIEEAVYKANQRSNRQLATAIVNGLASGLSTESGNLQSLNLTVVLGNKELKDFVVKTANESLNQKGRKNLNAVTGY